jgi:hypothetical protein
MAKNHEAAKLISPTNLWGKPLTRPPNKPAQEKVTGMRTEDDEDFTDEDEIDVDAELAEEDESAEELVDETPDDVESEITAEAEEDDAEEEGDVEDDGLAYDPEDGDESEEDAVVSAVDADDEEESGDTDETEVAETTPESRKRTMPEKKKMSLSDHIRHEIDRRKSSNGASLRGVDIVAALEKRGISVSPAQVSQLLKKAGVAGTRARKTETEEQTSERSRSAMKAKKNAIETPKKPMGLKRNVPVAATVTPTRSALKAAPSASGRFSVPVDQLKAAEAFVSACGGFEKATRILTTAAELSNAFNG